MHKNSEDILILGKISGAYGIKGWVKVFSHTRKKEEILNYTDWLIGKEPGSNARGKEKSWDLVKVISGRPHGKTVVVQLEGCLDRNAAEALVGREIAIKKADLPQPRENEYYWFDLQGLKVENLKGESFGIIETLFETGANDVLVVKGDKERLIPFVQGQYVLNINIPEGKMIVDWELDF